MIAQGDVPNEPNFKISLSNDKPKIGDIIEIIIKSDVPAGIYMYSTHSKCGELGPNVFDLNLGNPKGFCIEGKPYSINDKKVFDDIFEKRNSIYLKMKQIDA